MAKINELKESNIQLVRNCFYDCQTWTKNDLSLKTGLSLAGTTNILQYLQSVHEIDYTGDAKSTGGRKSKKYILNKDFKHIGLITLMKNEHQYLMNAFIYDLYGDMLNQFNIESHIGLLAELDQLIESICHDLLVQTIVVSIPGVCCQGVIDFCDYKNLENINIKEYFKTKYNIRIIIENDVNVACVGLSKQYPEISHLALVYQPAADYVGCGLIINHQLHNGYSHFSGELRYLPFYSHEEQNELLHTHPKLLLTNQIMTLICVVNPELIGYCSDVFNDDLQFETSFSKKHLPKLIHIKNFNETLINGLYSIGLKTIKERGKENE